MKDSSYVYSSAVEFGLPDLEISPSDSIASIIDMVAIPIFEAMKNEADIVVRPHLFNGEAVLYYNYTNIDAEHPLTEFNCCISVDELFNELTETMPEAYGDEAKDEISKIISSIDESLIKLKKFRDSL